MAVQQIPKIRIGNTIHVGLSVLAGGQPRDLTGLVITVVLVDNRGTKSRINGWTIEGESHNIIRFVLQGFRQEQCGIYKVIVFENAGKPNQSVVDTRLFELVRESAMEEGVDSGLINKDVDLSIGGIMIGGRDGTGIADIQQVQSSSASLGENIWKITLTDEREYNIVIRNGGQGQQGTPGKDGQDGEDGYTPVKGVDYFTPAEIAAIKNEIISEVGGDFYTKPSGGIPKSDLSDDVKTSLGKADSALQSFTESDPTVPAWAKQPSKPSYTAQEVGALPASTTIPTKTSDLTNDSGFLTQHQDISGKQDTISDLATIRSGAQAGSTALQPSDLADWAKAPNKPNYTPNEVGALPSTTKYAGSQSVGGAANKAVSLPIATVDSSSVSNAINATVDGITELRNGVFCYLRNNVVNTVGGFTLNVNGLGAKYVYSSISDTAKISNQFSKTTSMLFIYNETRIEGGCWDMFFGVDTDLNDAAYRIRAINAGRVAYNTIKANILILSKDSKYVIAVNESGSTGTNKTLTTESFDPFGQIWNYSNGTIDIAPEGSVPNGYLWCQVGQHDARRSFNISTNEFEIRKDVYLVAVPQSDGTAKLHSSPITQTLPSTEDGLIYIYLGIANAAYQFDLYLKHPIYYFKDGALRLWTNTPTTSEVAEKALSIPTGQVDSTSTATAFTATVDGITELRDGVCVLLKNGVVTSTNNCTLNINGLGAKPMYFTNLAESRVTSQFNSAHTALFIYNSTRVSGGCWDLFVGYDTDSNSVGYQIRAERGDYASKTALYGSHLVFQCSETELLPVNTISYDINTNKQLTTESFNPFGIIGYYMGAAKSAGGTLSADQMWLQRGIDIRPSFNTGNTLTANKDIYVVCDPQSDGMVKLASNPISQDLPTTEDGKVYIYLGAAYSANSINLSINHPIYYYKDGALRQWTNQDTTAQKLGTTTIGGTTQGIFLNQGVPTACDSYDMWYMKHIAALYGATRNDATGLWSYHYRRCARWDDTQEKIVWDREIGYDDITDAEMMNMCNHRLLSLQGTYGWAKSMVSRIAFHFIGYGNNQGANGGCRAYIGNNDVVTYGYIGQKGNNGWGDNYFPLGLQDTFLVPKVKHIIGRSGYSGNDNYAPANSLLEYATLTFGANNATINFGTCPNIEFVSIMYTLTDNGGTNRTGCKLILHPDVYAKIFDSTNADYTLWHKIDVANQARTNPITIQSA